MNKIYSIFRTFKPNIKDITIQAYTQNITKLMKLLELNENDINGLFKKLEDKQNIYNLLQDRNYTTIRNFYNGVIVILQATDPNSEILKEYIIDRDNYNKQYSQEALSNEPSKKQRRNWITIDEVNDTIEYWRSRDIQKYMLLSLFIKYPFRNNLRNMEIVKNTRYRTLDPDDKVERNFFIIHKKGVYELAFNDYKTFRTYGEKRFSITDTTLINDLTHYLKETKKTSYLFTAPNGGSFTSNAFTKYVNSIFVNYEDKRIGTTLLRHILLSDALGEVSKIQNALSNIYGHSTETQSGYIKHI